MLNYLDQSINSFKSVAYPSRVVCIPSCYWRSIHWMSVTLNWIWEYGPKMGQLRRRLDWSRFSKRNPQQIYWINKSVDRKTVGIITWPTSCLSNIRFCSISFVSSVGCIVSNGSDNDMKERRRKQCPVVKEIHQPNENAIRENRRESELLPSWL